MATSIVMMTAVTAVNVMPAANEGGPPVGESPIWIAMHNLVNGKVARGDGAYNIGMLMGMSGVASILPVVAVLAAFWIYFALTALWRNKNVVR
jgi:hypothetical protein